MIEGERSVGLGCVGAGGGWGKTLGRWKAMLRSSALPRSAHARAHGEEATRRKLGPGEMACAGAVSVGWHSSGLIIVTKLLMIVIMVEVTIMRRRRRSAVMARRRAISKTRDESLISFPECCEILPVGILSGDSTGHATRRRPRQLCCCVRAGVSLVPRASGCSAGEPFLSVSACLAGCVAWASRGDQGSEGMHLFARVWCFVRGGCVQAHTAPKPYYTLGHACWSKRSGRRCCWRRRSVRPPRSPCCLPLTRDLACA